MYLDVWLDKSLEQIKPILIGTHSYNFIVGQLNLSLKTEGFVFNFKRNTFMGKNDLAVSGLYDVEKNKKIVTIIFSKHFKEFTIKRNFWKRFKFAISQTCQHEVIHQCQWAFRTYNTNARYSSRYRFSQGNYKQKIYLSDPDEVEAYAHDIAMEIKFFYPKRNPYHVLKYANRFANLWSYQYYRQTFGKKDWKLIQPKLIRKTYRWLGA